MPLIVRPATLDDAREAVTVRIASWRESYKGLVPDTLLDSMNVEEDIAGFSRMMNDPSDASLRFVAELDGKIVGIGSCGADHKTAKGRIYAIYLLNEAKGKGIGKKLMATMAQALAKQGMTSLGLGVFRDNHCARGFYERIGGQLRGEGIFTYKGVSLPDVDYVWDDIKTLAA